MRAVKITPTSAHISLGNGCPQLVFKCDMTKPVTFQNVVLERCVGGFLQRDVKKYEKAEAKVLAKREIELARMR